MSAHPTIEAVAVELLSKKGLHLISCKILQSLWAGYGHICQITATSNNATNGAQNDKTTIPVILKYINPLISDQGMSEGHIRKILSYQIEQFFYTHLVQQMPPEIAVASCIASIGSHDTGVATAMLLEDLRRRFPVAGEKREALNEVQTYAALRWLARFHGFWWTRAHEIRQSGLIRPPREQFKNTGTINLPDGGIWLNGGYTYLATRRSEFADLVSDESSEWSKSLCEVVGDERKSVAELVAEFLAPSIQQQQTTAAEYTTLIHGDVKSENLFTTKDGKQVAFFDFQYVGLGLGVCDLAKLFTCSVPVELLDDSHAMEDKVELGGKEEMLLRFYLDELQIASGKQYDWSLFVRHWEVALVDWLRFQASWGFWGNTRWLECRVRSVLVDSTWRKWLNAQV